MKLFVTGSEHSAYPRHLPIIFKSALCAMRAHTLTCDLVGYIGTHLKEYHIT